MFPADGIKIISGTLHSHRAGRKITLRHVRAGKELERIIEDDNYDFNYQQVRQLDNETVVLPGDYIITDCAYEVNSLFEVEKWAAHLFLFKSLSLNHFIADNHPQASYIWWLFYETRNVSVIYYILSENRFGRLL